MKRLRRWFRSLKPEQRFGLLVVIAWLVSLLHWGCS